MLLLIHRYIMWFRISRYLRQQREQRAYRLYL